MLADISLVKFHIRSSVSAIYRINVPDTVAPLAWVPWAPGNPSIFEQRILEPISFGKKGVKFTPFSVQIKQGIGLWSFGTLHYHLETHQFEYLTKPLNCIALYSV